MLTAKYDQWRERHYWTPGDLMPLRWVLVWHMCKSKNRVLRWLGNRIVKGP